MMGTPDLAFNPARSYNMINRGLQYAIGNTPACDMSEECILPTHSEFLLIGCGDVRNVLYTVGEVAQLKEKPESLHFHLNDVDDPTLARAALLLKIVDTIDLSKQDDLEFLLSVWYNTHLTKSQHERLIFLLQDCLENPHDCFTYGNVHCKEKLRWHFKTWLKSKTSMSDLRRSREEFVIERNVNNFPGTHCSFEEAYSMLTMNSITSVASIFHMQGFENGAYESEFTNYYKYGSSLPMPSYKSLEEMDRSMYPNLTLYCPVSKAWRVHPSSSPFMCYDIELFDPKKTLRENCLSHIKKLVERWQGFCSSGGSIKATLWTGDGLTLCNFHLPSAQMFDFINTSNIVDTIGLMNVLLSCGKRLKQNGVLGTQILKWSFHCKSLREYLDVQLEIPPELYATLLGVMLVEDLSVGNTTVPKMGIHAGVDEITIKWIRTVEITHLINILESPDLLSGFSKIAQTCLTAFTKKEIVLTGFLMKTPTTLVYLIKNMSRIVEGGAETLIRITEQHLPTQEHVDGSFRPVEAEWKMLLHIHFPDHTDTLYEPVTTEITFLSQCYEFQLKKEMTGADYALRGRLLQKPFNQSHSRFRLATTLEYNFKSETFTALLPRSVYNDCQGQYCFVPCKSDGQPLTNGALLVPRQSTPYTFRVHSPQKTQKSFSGKVDLNITESIEGFQIQLSPVFEPLWQITKYETFVKEPRDLKVHLRRKRNGRPSEMTIRCKLPCPFLPNTKLARKEDGAGYVRLKKKDCASGQELQQRSFDLRELEKCTFSVERMRLLINLVVLSPTARRPDATCSLIETIHAIMLHAIADYNPQKVKLYYVQLAERGADFPCHLIGYYPEDTCVAIRDVHQVNGRPYIDIIWFDFSVLHQQNLMGNRRYATDTVLNEMGLQIEKMSGSAMVSQEIAWQFKELLAANTRRTVQRRKGVQISWYFDAYLRAVYPYFSKSAEISSIFASGAMPYASNVDKTPMGWRRYARPYSNCCEACGTSSFDLKKCSACKKVSYCGRECQRNDWQRHKQSCKKVSSE